MGLILAVLFARWPLPVRRDAACPRPMPTAQSCSNSRLNAGVRRCQRTDLHWCSSNLWRPFVLMILGTQLGFVLAVRE